MTPPRSILIVMLSALGDAVQVLPVVSALRRAYPAARITWVVQPGPHTLVRHHPGVDDFILFRRGPRSRSPGALLSAANALGRTVRAIGERAAGLPGGRFDLLLDLQVYFKAGLITALSPAAVKLGFDRARSRDLNGLFVNRRIPPHPQGFAHTQDQYFEFLRHLGVDPEPVEYHLGPAPGEREAQRSFFARLPGPACGIVVGTSDARKNWYAGRYARVVEGVAERFGLHPVLLGGPSPRDRTMIEKIMEEVEGPPPPVTPVLGDDLRRLLWILDGCAVVVSPDTGPLHVARAMDVPVVGLYGFTNPKRSGPYRKFTELVVDGYAAVPGERYPVCMERRPGGMARVRPGEVLEKVEAALTLRRPGT